MKTLFAAMCVLALSYGSAVSGDFPPEAAYLFFVGGEPAGRTDIVLTAVEGRYVFESQFKVRFGEENHTLTCRTELDRKTLRPLLFKYEGDRNGTTLSGTLKLDADSVRAVQEAAGRPLRKREPWTEGTMIFQNYVIEHMAAIGRRLSESGKVYDRFPLLFPTEMMTTTALAVVESELELPVASGVVVCKKYAVSLQNSFPFYLYVASKDNSLIYLDFPANKTEVFLRGAFGDRPKTKYTLEKEPDSQE